MPGIQILAAESDGSGGVVIHWYDPANLDGQPLEGFFHATEEALDELVIHQRRPNRAPEERLNTARGVLAAKRGRGKPVLTPADVDEVAQAWRDAYDEVLTDNIDRRRLGLKAVTRDGHEDLEAVRNGAPVRPWNARVPEGKDKFDAFVKERGNR
jgi:hypothetical protein